MKNKSISKLSSGVAVAAMASLAMLGGTAQADQMASDKAELGISVLHSSIEATGGMPSKDFDFSQYEQVNLGSLSSTLWVPKRPAGAQGPMRDDQPSEHEKQWQEIQSRLGPIGGMNTP